MDTGTTGPTLPAHAICPRLASGMKPLEFSRLEAPLAKVARGEWLYLPKRLCYYVQEIFTGGDP